MLFRHTLLAALALVLAACTTPQADAQPTPTTAPAPTAEPQRGGLDTAPLAELIVRLRRGEYEDITSLLIVYNDQLVVEEYYSIYTRADPHSLYSVSKSFMSAAIGIAIDEGYVESVNDPVLDYYPDLEWLVEDDPPVADMTLDHLLTMQGGYDWLELSSAAPIPNADVLGLINSDDYVGYSFSRERLTDPGTRFTYGSYGPLILSGVINQQTGQSTEVLLEEHLFAPLNMDSWVWQQDSQSVTNTGWGLSLRPLDMVKFGLLYLYEGQWAGQQIISPEWIAESTRSHVTASQTREYGYLWWRFPDDSLIGRRLDINDAYFAAGAGGQYIVVIPHLELVVVCTASDFGTDYFPNILKDFILPFAQNSAAS